MESVLLQITAHVKSVGKEPFATFVSLCLGVFMEHVLRLLNVNVTMAGQEAIVIYPIVMTVKMDIVMPQISAVAIMVGLVQNVIPVWSYQDAKMVFAVMNPIPVFVMKGGKDICVMSLFAILNAMRIMDVVLKETQIFVFVILDGRVIPVMNVVPIGNVQKQTIQLLALFQMNVDAQLKSLIKIQLAYVTILP